MLPVAATTLLSAFLLFQVQPIIAKAILPWFGGTPAVWTTCMLFFQVALLGGYAWSNLLVSRLEARRQAQLQGGLLLGALAVLVLQAAVWGTPSGLDPAWKPSDSHWPILRICALLAASVGLPYFALATTGPLMQAWTARLHPERSTYRLYALSNFGSLAGLLAYPFVIEPALPLRVQQVGWAAGFAAFAALGLLVARRVAAHDGSARGPSSGAGAGAAAVEGAPRSVEGDVHPPPTKARALLWAGLAATASVMLLATTSHLCQEVAVVPFLWIVPLAIYLLTFIVCFDSERWYVRQRFVLLLAAGTLAVVLAFYRGVHMGIGWQIACHATLLFAACMVCHGELARLRPSPRHLTGFYLWVSAGGALGAVLVGIVAPLATQLSWELHAGIVATWALALVAMLADPASALHGWNKRAARAGMAAVVIAAAVLVLPHVGAPLDNALEVSRSFYGVLRVLKRPASDGQGTVVTLMHGRIMHGREHLRAGKRLQPSTYYHSGSGIGLAILHHPKRVRGEPMRLAVVGLGIGTLSAYGRPEDLVRFYEINPDIIRLARGPHFSYLRDALASTEVVLGDARLSLERELREGRPGRYQVLALDAFSSDAIPAHLLTRESFELYRAHLAEDGVLAVHVSNRFLDLRPVVSRLGQAVGMPTLAIEAQEAADGSDGERCIWMLLAREPSFFELPEIRAAVAASPQAELDASTPLWTDDHSALLQAVRPARED